MTHKLAYLSLLPALVIAIRPLSASTSLQPMSRDEMVALAETSVGYSYKWGGACWTADGSDPGTCVGVCPDCVHTGPWGADCSGHVGKIWQVPRPSPLEECFHPYNTRHFRHETYHWEPIPRSEALRGDAFVYRNEADTRGHVVLFDRFDPSGDAWVWECAGCAIGCVYRMRALGPEYIAIRRNLVDDGVSSTEGLQGVVYANDETTDISNRVPGASVFVPDIAGTTAAQGSAYWSLELPVGVHTVHATAPGFIEKSRVCEVIPGRTQWCSIGLAPDCRDVCQDRVCGVDPRCGVSCGECAPDESCKDGQCICRPDCRGRVCGKDPRCGESCGTCPPGLYCDKGRCLCHPQCPDNGCGYEPNCGVLCGHCPPALYCAPDNACRPIPPGRGKLFGVITGPSGEDGETGHFAEYPILIDGVEHTETDETGYYELLLSPGTYLVKVRDPAGNTSARDCRVAAGSQTDCSLDLPDPVSSLEEPSTTSGCAAGQAHPRSPTALMLLLLAVTGFLARRRIEGVAEG